MAEVNVRLMTTEAARRRVYLCGKADGAGSLPWVVKNSTLGAGGRKRSSNAGQQR
jgi:hypothetical protein